MRGNMSTFLIAVVVAAIVLMIVDQFLSIKDNKEKISEVDRMKIKIQSLEAKLEAATEIESKIQALLNDNKKVWDTLDHVQNMVENDESFMKANQHEIKSLQKTNETLRGGYIDLARKMQEFEQKIPDKIKVELQEFKKPLVAEIQQTRAQRPVRVTWKKGHKGWFMADKTVEYSRAEYLKKLKKGSRGKQ